MLVPPAPCIDAVGEVIELSIGDRMQPGGINEVEGIIGGIVVRIAGPERT